MPAGSNVCKRCGYLLDGLALEADGTARCPECSLVQVPGPPGKRRRVVLAILGTSSVVCQGALCAVIASLTDGWGDLALRVTLLVLGPLLVAFVASAGSLLIVAMVPSLGGRASARSLLGVFGLGVVANLIAAFGLGLLAIDLWPGGGC